MLFDTDILIWLERGNLKATKTLYTNQRIKISAIYSLRKLYGSL